MTDYQKKQLEQQLWNVANQLRGKIHADEFRDYCLGFIFFKYLSEKMHHHANSILDDGRDYLEINELSEDGLEELDAIREDSVHRLGFFIKPSQLFASLAKRGGEEPPKFILDDLTAVLKSVERSTMGTESEDDFEHLFEDLDLTSTKLGRTEAAKNALIAKILTQLNKIDFLLDEVDSDVLGDAYEYLIGQFASGAGKKAGEFYTPASVSTILAKIVTTGKDRLKSVYDPTCGSGSLLLRISREVEVGDYYGQEMNRTTYNLCRMNMIMHEVHYRNFDIKQEDTLEHPQHLEKRFEAVVANPPFSAKWSANLLHLGEDRFSQYGKLAPASKADFAFVQHMLYQLDDSGTMAVILPHGVLFRGAAEGHIRKYLIQERNWLDAVIGLPANIFYGTGIPTCILVFKKCREFPKDVLFIDASGCFEKGSNQNYLRSQDIGKIVSTYRERTEEVKYSRSATLQEIANNDFNLSIPRYVDTFEEKEPMELGEISEKLAQVEKIFQDAHQKVETYCTELSIKPPNGCNIQLLETYKRRLIQKFFSCELRFKADDGSEFPNWREGHIKDLISSLDAGVSVNSGDRPAGKVEKGILKTSCVSFGFFLASENKVVLSESELHRLKEPVRAGTVVISRMNTPALVGANAYVDRDYQNLYLPDRLWAAKIKPDHCSKWVAILLSNDKTRSAFSDRATGTSGSMKNITKEDVLTVPVSYPSRPEQQKIADFLSAVDGKINAVAGQIDGIEQLKKGLLQQMFV